VHTRRGSRGRERRSRCGEKRRSAAQRQTAKVTKMPAAVRARTGSEASTLAAAQQCRACARSVSRHAKNRAVIKIACTHRRARPPAHRLGRRWPRAPCVRERQALKQPPRGFSKAGAQPTMQAGSASRIPPRAEGAAPRPARQPSRERCRRGEPRRRRERSVWKKDALCGGARG
jgi:hypothetical protein